MNDLISKYINAAKLHGEGTLEGNSDKSNTAYDELMKIYFELKNTEKVADLSILLKHSNSSVRSWAASRLLPIFETESIDVLEEVSKEKSLVGFSAETTLKEWKSGKLKF